MERSEKLKEISEFIGSQAVSGRIESQTRTVELFEKMLTPTTDDKARLAVEKSHLAIFVSDEYLRQIVNVIAEEYDRLGDEELETMLKQVRLENALRDIAAGIFLRCAGVTEAMLTGSYVSPTLN